jgi:hypothetical protein
MTPPFTPLSSEVPLGGRKGGKEEGAQEGRKEKK